MSSNYEKIQSGIQTAFIDYTQASGQTYRPKLISNDYKKGRKVISAIEEELRNLEAGDSFAISVAFITDNGLEYFLQAFKELEEKGVRGRVLTTDYLTFSSPSALKKLNTLSNIEVKMYRVGEGPGFHTKGYIFRKGELVSIIVGSSNMTAAALTKNAEWNTKVVSTINGEFARETLIEFNYYWNQADSIDEWIEAYEKAYRKQKQIASQNQVISYEVATLRPNDMQVAFTVNLNKSLEDGEDRALLISATGTGKTYASAFALRDAEAVDFKRILFVVHREQIARQAMKSYQKIFGGDKTYGILSGNNHDTTSDLIFATVQTLYKDYVLHQFAPDAFDAIVLDEVHRAGAMMHQKIIDYFKPKLYLGMTASPERTDGYDIYALFNHNIACEIRLQQALEGDYLCPFHYFGISDFEVNGVTIDDKSDFNALVLDARVNHIIDKISYYGFSGDRVKGLIFCSRKDEAKALSDKFNDRGYRTVSLSGETSQEERQKAIDRLAGDDDANALDYIFTVDIFNEGVDIPEINQVVMLRPTQSPVVFVQQLGRGLRKHKGKEFVVIIDFIGNYENNFMIPIALSGDRSYNPDRIRKYVREGSRVIPGESSIHFDKVSRQRIYDMISKMRPRKKMLEEKYYNLKYKLGRIPTVVDFYDYGEIDPLLFVDYSGSYDQFVRNVDKEYEVQFSAQEERTIEFISSNIIKAKRLYEPLIMEHLLYGGVVTEKGLCADMQRNSEMFDVISFASAIRVIDKSFLVANDVEKYKNVEIIRSTNDGEFALTNEMSRLLDRDDFAKEIEALIEYAIKKYKREYKNHDENGMVLYEKYSRRDACRILNWEKDESSTIYGYRIKHNTCPIFVTYEKSDEIVSSTKYADEFIDESTFQWSTRNRVTIDHKEAQALINYKTNGLKPFLFIKKDDDEGSDFYYMGPVAPVGWEEATIPGKHGKELPVVHFKLRLKHDTQSDIYEYFTEAEGFEKAR